jgi:hypothetical protein
VGVAYELESLFLFSSGCGFDSTRILVLRGRGLGIENSHIFRFWWAWLMDFKVDLFLVGVALYPTR